jgi:hypothetical protein
MNNTGTQDAAQDDEKDVGETTDVEKAVVVLRKNVLTLMALFSLLGDRAVVSEQVHGVGPALTDALGVIATTATATGVGAESGSVSELAVLLYSSNGVVNVTTPPATNVSSISLRLEALQLPKSSPLSPTSSALSPSTGSVLNSSLPVLTHYRIDQTNCNPRALWEKLGGEANPYPTPAQVGGSSNVPYRAPHAWSREKAVAVDCGYCWCYC